MRVRRILELVHEQVVNPIVERQCKIRRRVLVAQCRTGRVNHLDEIDAAAFGEHHAQHGRCHAEYIQQCDQHRKFRV